jgi:hypothetical protein
VVRKALALAVVLSSIGLPAVAQSTATPNFLSPYRAFNRTELGAAVSDPGRGGGVTVEGFYRFGQNRYDIGFRAGIADNGANATQFLTGVDFRTRVIDHSVEFPLDGAFTAGIGGRFGSGSSQLYLPVGITLGRRIQLEDSNVEFVPYFHPVLAPSFGDDNNDSRLLFGLGLGVDITFNRRFDLRVSGAVGDFDGIGVGFAILR